MRGRAIGPCDGCGVFTTKRCPLCRVRRYCSEDCQFARWEAHKMGCKSIAAAARDPRCTLRAAELLMRLDAALAEGGIATAYTDATGEARVVRGDRGDETAGEEYRLTTSEDRLPRALVRGLTRPVRLRWIITHAEDVDPIVPAITGLRIKGRAIMVASAREHADSDSDDI